MTRGDPAPRRAGCRWASVVNVAAVRRGASDGEDEPPGAAGPVGAVMERDDGRRDAALGEPLRERRGVGTQTVIVEPRLRHGDDDVPARDRAPERQLGESALALALPRVHEYDVRPFAALAQVARDGVRVADRPAPARRVDRTHLAELLRVDVDDEDVGESRVGEVDRVVAPAERGG